MRVVTSTASAKADENFLRRRLPRKPTIHRGRPSPMTKPMPRAMKIFSPKINGGITKTTPVTALRIQKRDTGIFSPACFSLAAMVTRALRSRRSDSCSCSMICLRRASGVFAAALRAAALLPVVTVKVWARFRACSLESPPPTKTQPRPPIVMKARTAARIGSMIVYSAASRASANSRSRP